MAKPKNAVPTVEKKIQIPMDLVTRMELELYSELEGKIPYGAQSEFINRLIRAHYQRMDNNDNAAVNVMLDEEKLADQEERLRLQRKQ